LRINLLYTVLLTVIINQFLSTTTYANARDDVNTPFAGGPTPGRKALLTPGDFEAWNPKDSVLTPPDIDPNRQIDSRRQNVGSLSMVQLA